MHLNVDTGAPADVHFFLPKVSWVYFALFSLLVFAAFVRLLRRLLTAWNKSRDIVLRADRAAVPAVASREVHGAPAVARRAAKGRARAARPALVNGAVGVVVAPRGRLLMVLDFTIKGGKIVEIDAIADPARLRQVDLAVLDD